jgi:hypothetical protein
MFFFMSAKHYQVLIMYRQSMDGNLSASCAAIVVYAADDQFRVDKTTNYLIGQSTKLKANQKSCSKINSGRCYRRQVQNIAQCNSSSGVQ